MQALRKRHERKGKLHAKPPRLSSPQAHLGDTWPCMGYVVHVQGQTNHDCQCPNKLRLRPQKTSSPRRRVSRPSPSRLVSSPQSGFDVASDLQTSEVSRAAGINRPTLGVIPHMGSRSHADAKYGECANRVGPWTDRTGDADEIRHTRYIFSEYASVRHDSMLHRQRTIPRPARGGLPGRPVWHSRFPAQFAQGGGARRDIPAGMWDLPQAAPSPPSGLWWPCDLWSDG